jgi:hypothetical protein
MGNSVKKMSNLKNIEKIVILFNLHKRTSFFCSVDADMRGIYGEDIRQLIKNIFSKYYE